MSETGEEAAVENANPQYFWENRYADSERVWSGRVNSVLSALVSELEPGRALDLGCGEGGDVIWLARQGWDAVGIDISATAVRRAATHAALETIEAGSAEFRSGHLPEHMPDGPFDLISAFFLQSPVALDRAAILKAAADRVEVGGHLLAVSHATAPPWAQHGHGPAEMPTVEGDLAALRPRSAWRIKVGEVRHRQAVGPDGQEVTLDDAVIFAEKVSADI